MEYLRGGDVATKIRQSGHVNEDVAWKYFRQLIGAVSFFHSKGMTHRDLKPQNLLLDSHGNLKVADFGLSATSDNLRGDHTVCGTRSFVAPEVVTCKEGYDGASVDVYSCGAILYHLLAGHMPIAEMSPAEYIRRAQTADFRFPDWFPDGVKDLIRRLLEPDPQKRLTIAQIERTRWYQKRPEASTTSTKRPEPSRTHTNTKEASRTSLKRPEASKTSIKEASRTSTNHSEASRTHINTKEVSRTHTSRSKTPTTPIKEALKILTKGFGRAKHLEASKTSIKEVSRTPTNHSEASRKPTKEVSKTPTNCLEAFVTPIKEASRTLIKGSTSTKHPKASRTPTKEVFKTPTNSLEPSVTPIKEALRTPTKGSRSLLSKIASKVVSSITCSGMSDEKNGGANKKSRHGC